MLTARASRTIQAPPELLWGVVCDPHHLPRWWPRVMRVEDVGQDAFTEVMRTSRGKVVRADFHRLALDEPCLSVSWAQRVAGTPFERVLRSAETEVRLSAPPQGPTEVTIELRQDMAGRDGRGGGLLSALTPRIGGRMVRRAALATIEQALDGLEGLNG